jgi:DNA (cytosine-5)-methyltransferase 1
MAEGFRRAGIEFMASFDRDPNACRSYEWNLGDKPIQLDVRSLREVVLIGRGGAPRPAFNSALDLLVADPPCTPWSRAGKRRGLVDERDMLLVTVDLIDVWRPRCWLLGNVPGLDDSSNAPALERVFARLRQHYCIDYASLDAAAYGVPQHRVRPFWFGHPKGTACIRWPAPTHGASPRQLQIEGTELLPYVTVRDALEHLTPKQLGQRIRLRWGRGRHGHPPSTPDRPAGTILAGQPSNCGNVLAVGPHHRPSRGDRPARTLTRNTHSDGALLEYPKHPISAANAPARAVLAGDRGGATGGRAMQWPWDRPSTTLTTRDEVPMCKRSGRRGQSQSYNAIKLSERAALILQGFPETWRVAGETKTARWSQIGQAVPPPFAAAVARSIASWFAAYACMHAYADAVVANDVRR